MGLMSMMCLKIILIILLLNFPVFANELVDGAYLDGGACAFYLVNTPPIIYDSITNKTFLAYQNREFDLYVTEYDHSTNEWSYPLKVGDGLTNDAHGAPAINIDSSGYLHIFGACHNSPMKHWKSNSVRDISAWTTQADIGTQATYPKTNYFNGKLYLFYREGSTTNADFVYCNEDDWTSTTTLVDNGTDSFYGSGLYNDGTYLYTCWTWYDGAGLRDDPSFGKFDGSKWYKADDTEITLPFTQANQDLIYSSAGCFVNVYDIKVDTNGVIYVLCSESDSFAYKDDGDFQCAVWSGGAWNVYAIAPNNNAFDNGSFDIINTTTIDAYITVDGIDDGSEQTRGGIVKRYRSTDNGQNWTLQDIISKTTYQSSAPYVIHSGHSDIKLIWTYGNSAPTWIDGSPTDVEVKNIAELQGCILQGVNFGQ